MRPIIYYEIELKNKINDLDEANNLLALNEIELKNKINDLDEANNLLAEMK